MNVMSYSVHHIQTIIGLTAMSLDASWTLKAYLAHLSGVESTNNLKIESTCWGNSWWLLSICTWVVIATNWSHWGLDSMTVCSILESNHLTVSYWDLVFQVTHDVMWRSGPLKQLLLHFFYECITGSDTTFQKETKERNVLPVLTARRSRFNRWEFFLGIKSWGTCSTWRQTETKRARED